MANPFGFAGRVNGMTPGQTHAITQWIVSEGLDGTHETTLLEGVCERLPGHSSGIVVALTGCIEP